MDNRLLLCLAAVLFASVGWMLGDVGLSAALLIAAQLIVFASCVVEKRVTAVGSFVFMYVMFFAGRPMYFFVEYDWELMSQVFRLPKEPELAYRGLRWATASLIVFRLGSLMTGAEKPLGLAKHYLSRHKAMTYMLNPRDVYPVLAIQGLTLLLLLWIIRSKGVLYTYGTGYVYDMPVPMQALHAFGVMFILNMLRLAPKSTMLKTALGISIVLFVLFTINMRSVSIFRSFYLTGFLILFFAWLSSRQKRVSYVWLVVPILIAMPIFDALGRLRFQTTDNAVDHIQANFKQMVQPSNYWDFFEGARDMNIFDSYVATLRWEANNHPYFKQWLYPAVHFIPRQVWPSKPPGGIQVDMGAMRGAPYSPGITGVFYLGGGYLYMLFSMGLLGYLIAKLNATIFAMREGVLKWTFYGTFVVNTMLLTRFFLFQFVWQILYIAVPCAVLHLLLIKKVRRKKGPGSPPPPRQPTLPQVRQSVNKDGSLPPIR